MTSSLKREPLLIICQTSHVCIGTIQMHVGLLPATEAVGTRSSIVCWQTRHTQRFSKVSAPGKHSRLWHLAPLLTWVYAHKTSSGHLQIYVQYIYCTCNLARSSSIDSELCTSDPIEVLQTLFLGVWCKTVHVRTVYRCPLLRSSTVICMHTQWQIMNPQRFSCPYQRDAWVSHDMHEHSMLVLLQKSCV